MPVPNHGALGMSFLAARGMQAASLIAIIGMAANFISEMVQASNTPPNVLVGTLIVVRIVPPSSLSRVFVVANSASFQTCIAVLYCLLTFILYWDNSLPFLTSTAVDSLLLLAVIIVAVTVGKPLSYMDCMTIGSQSGNVKSAYSFAANMGHTLNTVGTQIDYATWSGANKTTCFEMKSIWGLSIALWYAFNTYWLVTLLLRSSADLLQHPLRLLCHLYHLPLASHQAQRRLKGGGPLEPRVNLCATSSFTNPGDAF